MQRKEIRVYIETNKGTQARVVRKCAYRMSSTLKGAAYDQDYFLTTDATYHQGILQAIGEALERVNVHANVIFYIKDQHIAAKLPDWKKIEQSGFKNTKNKPISNLKEWQRIAAALSEKHKTTGLPIRILSDVIDGEHEQSSRLLDEMRKR